MFTGMSLGEIVGRIDRRLEALGISAAQAERRAGKPDLIRNLRRAVKSGRQGVGTKTLNVLAPALATTVEWLTTGVGKEQAGEPRDADAVYKRSGTIEFKLELEAVALGIGLLRPDIPKVDLPDIARSLLFLALMPPDEHNGIAQEDQLRLRIQGALSRFLMK